MMRSWNVVDAPARDQICEIGDVLLAGGVVLLPTDTIYGLHALAISARAVGRLVDIKGRTEEKPFVVIGASVQQLEQLGARFEAAVRDALAELWPGPLTAIVPLQKPVAASRGTVALAVRVPAVDWLRRLLIRTGPLASTSANRSGEPPIIDPDTLPRSLQKSLDGVVRAGVLAGEPSTIVDFTGGEPRLVREGNSTFTQKMWKTLRKSL